MSLTQPARASYNTTPALPTVIPPSHALLHRHTRTPIPSPNPVHKAQTHLIQAQPNKQKERSSEYSSKHTAPATSSLPHKPPVDPPSPKKTNPQHSTAADPDNHPATDPCSNTVRGMGQYLTYRSTPSTHARPAWPTHLRLTPSSACESAARAPSHLGLSDALAHGRESTLGQAGRQPSRGRVRNISERRQQILGKVRYLHTTCL